MMNSAKFKILMISMFIISCISIAVTIKLTGVDRVEPVDPDAMVDSTASLYDQCLQNINIIDGVKQQWALDNNLPGSAMPTWGDLIKEFPYYLKAQPVCPCGGKYTIGMVDDMPTCSLSNDEHKTDKEKSDKVSAKLNQHDISKCQENLAKIDGSKQQWALDNDLSVSAKPTWKDLVNEEGSGYMAVMPKCPAGGTYTLGTVDEIPICSIKGHTLP